MNLSSSWQIVINFRRLFSLKICCFFSLHPKIDRPKFPESLITFVTWRLPISYFLVTEGLIWPMKICGDNDSLVEEDSSECSISHCIWMLVVGNSQKVLWRLISIDIRTHVWPKLHSRTVPSRSQSRFFTLVEDDWIQSKIFP